MEIRSLCANPPIVGLHKGGMRDCDEWVSFHRGVLSDIAAEHCAISKLQGILQENINDHLEDCSQCISRAARLQRNATTILNEVPEFNSFFS